MIKNYLQLSYDEKIKANEFNNRKYEKKKSIDEFEKSINNKLYDFGKGALFYIKNNKVLGKILVILEPTKVLHTAYITGIDIEKGHREGIVIFKDLLNKSIELANKYTAVKVVLLSKDRDIWSLLGGLGIYKQYSTFKMELKDKRKCVEPLDIEELSSKNLDEYIDTFNSAFNDMPHGCYTDKNDMRERLSKPYNKERYFLVKNHNTTVGFTSISIEGNRGFFDIGLRKEFRGKGLGKRLLETAIELLKKENIEKICLIVIEKNHIAYRMYKKRGFHVYEKVSDCAEICGKYWQIMMGGV